eukprot:gene12058-biopygen8486
MAAILAVLAAAWRQYSWQQRHSGGSDGTVGGILAALAGGSAALWRHNCHSAAFDGSVAAQLPFGGAWRHGGTVWRQWRHIGGTIWRHGGTIGGTGGTDWRHSATGGTGGT